MKFSLLILILPFFLIGGCDTETYTPKPKGYFRIDLPKKSYHTLKKDCPFTCEIPNYTSIKQDINRPDKPCWFNIDFNELNASIYLSYKPVNNNLNQYIEDSRTLAFKHTIKANDIEQQNIIIPEHKVYGLIYYIEGNAASSFQFHLTDSTNHFVRGSLYFNNLPNRDSVQPVLNFIEKDIIHMFKTFEWK